MLATRRNRSGRSGLTGGYRRAWKAYAHDGTDARRTLSRNRSTLQLHQVAGDREAETASGLASPGTVHFVESLEDPREVLLGNAGSQIPHRDLNPGVVCSGRDLHVPRSCELERVVDDILQGLVGLAPVAQRMDAVLNRRSSELKSGRCCSLLVASDDLCDEPANAEWCTLDLDALSIQRRELHEIQKDRLQPLRFLNDAIHEKSGI